MTATQSPKISIASLPEPDDPRSGWADNQRSIRRHAAHENVEEFLKWSTIQKTMFVGQAPYIVKTLSDLYERGLSLSPILDDGFGGADTFIDPITGVRTSGTYIQHYYDLLMFEDIATLKVSTLSALFEVGGGYGVAPVVAHRMGFNGEYLIYDLPEMLILQNYYINHFNLPIGILLLESLGTCSIATELLLAKHSLSEMRMELRMHLLKNIIAKCYFFVYHPNWDEVDNVQFFQHEIPAMYRNYTWTHRSNPFLSEIRYTVGVQN